MLFFRNISLLINKCFVLFWIDTIFIDISLNFFKPLFISYFIFIIKPHKQRRINGVIISWVHHVGESLSFSY